MENTQINKIKACYKWLIAIIVVVVFLGSFLFTQNPTIISASVSPEVIVKGQSQEIIVTAVVKSGWIVPVKIMATMTERGYIGELKTQGDYLKYYSVFKRNPQALGYLRQEGMDSQGNRIYVGRFTIQKDSPQTAQINLTNFGVVLTAKRLAISTKVFTLPPDPGDGGKQTPEGVDSDKDGLRDDVQREIMFLAPESEKLRMALGQYARAEQLLTNQTSLNRKQSGDLMDKSMDGLQCLAALQKLDDPIIYTHYAFTKSLENLLVNTPARKKLKEQNYQIAGGQFTGFIDINRCSFNPADYPD